MRYLALLAVVLSMSSCNTFIGIGRDCGQAYDWTKGKIQGTDGGTSNSDGAPVY